VKIALVARHAAPTAVADPYARQEAEHVLGLGHALAAQGHRVVLYARRDRPGLPGKVTLAPGLTAEYLTAGPAAPVPREELQALVADIGRHLASRWKRAAPDVVHAHHWTNGLAALLAARERPVPVVQSFGSLGSAEQRHGLPGSGGSTRVRMEGSIARAVDRIVAHTTEEVAELARLGIASSRVSVVPCAFDASQFGPDGPVTARGDRLRLLQVGSLAEHERLDLLLRALPEMPRAELVVAGGPAQDELESDLCYKKLGKLAAGLGVADRVTVTGAVSLADLPALLRSSDLLVSATRYEPFGLAAIRAMACGTPVVATAVGGYADAVIDETTGLLAPPGRTDIFLRRLRDLSGSPMKLAAFSIGATDRARSRYPWERIAGETAAAYRRSLARSAGLPAQVRELPAQRAGSVRRRQHAA